MAWQVACAVVVAVEVVEGVEVGQFLGQRLVVGIGFEIHVGVVALSGFPAVDAHIVDHEVALHVEMWVRGGVDGKREAVVAVGLGGEGKGEFRPFAVGRRRHVAHLDVVCLEALCMSGPDVESEVLDFGILCRLAPYAEGDGTGFSSGKCDDGSEEHVVAGEGRGVVGHHGIVAAQCRHAVVFGKFALEGQRTLAEPPVGNGL